MRSFYPIIFSLFFGILVTYISGKVLKSFNLRFWGFRKLNLFTPWKKAYKFPGSKQLGLGKRLLEKYPWWLFKSHFEWVEAHPMEGDFFKPLSKYIKPYAAVIPKKLRIFYIPAFFILSKIKKIERRITYNAFYNNPRKGVKYDLGTVVPEVNGDWQPPKPPLL